MIADLVKCCWCSWTGTVGVGDEFCPCCGRKGFLAWQDDNKQEVEI